MKKNAFTLAEVLITLTIIGVIAALTIPNLMQKWSDHADVAKVKDAYSILSNALRMAVAENGSIDSWDWPNTTSTAWDIPENRLYMAQMMQKYLKVAKFCGNDDGKGSCKKTYAFDTNGNSGIFPRGLGGTYPNGSLGRLDRMARIQLTNGMLIGFDTSNIYYDKLIYVDINGAKKPNRAGYDWFLFPYEVNGKLIPGYYNYQYNCNRDPAVSAGHRDGSACAHWVIKHGNMDYKYRDVSAEW